MLSLFAKVYFHPWVPLVIVGILLLVWIVKRISNT